MPTVCARILLGFTSTPSTGRRSWGNEIIFHSQNRIAGSAVFRFPRSPAALFRLSLPPQISYDDAEPAVQLADPPKPVEVVELPKLLPLPGQLKPLHGAPSKPESGDPRKRVEKANAARARAADPQRLH